jgi:5-methyltetrahydrofolate--homocysteine methyltransferase
MIIVGELINASRKAVTAAIENKDTKAIQQLAIDQAENGVSTVLTLEPSRRRWLFTKARP